MEKQTAKNSSQLIEIFKVIGGTSIGLYGLYLGVSLIIYGGNGGFIIFQESTLKSINLIPGAFVIITSLWISLLTLSSRPTVFKGTTKIDKKDNTLTLILTDLLIPVMFIAGIALAILYIKND